MTKRLLASCAFLTACSAVAPPSDPDAGLIASAAASAAAVPSSSAAPQDLGRVAALTLAELKRAPTLVTAADQQSRDVAVRRAAARALARIGGEAARPGLLRALSDEDAEVVAWAAYGLGFWCKGHERDNTSALSARAAGAPSGGEGCSGVGCDVEGTIARAIGKCASEESEPTLVAWLAGPKARAVAAAYALGDVANAKQKLREETIAALLNVAAGSAATPAVPEALYPFSRVEHLPPNVIARAREVATSRLADPGPARVWAIRTLGLGAEDAGVELQRVVSTPGSFTAIERAEAARALKSIPNVGPRLLAEVLPKLVPASDPLALAGLVAEDTGALISALEVLAESPSEKAPHKGKRDIGASGKRALAALSALSAPAAAPAPVLRRVAWLRCLSAEARVAADYRDKSLATCDVSAGAATGEAAEGLAATSIGARATVEVLGRAPLEGPRLAAWRVYAERGDVRAREAAIALLEKHEEVKVAHEVLALALTDAHSGVVAAAAEVLAKHPELASAPPAKGAKAAKKRKKKRGKREVIEIDGAAAPDAVVVAPSPEIVKALMTIVADPKRSADPELLDAVVDAAGALGLKEASGRLDELCKGPYPTTREHAQKALGLIGDKKTCAAPGEGGPAPEELASALEKPVTLRFDTDVGALTMTLDPAIAPAAVTRFVGLAKKGFYDGKIVHRVVLGFVSQFGAPDGDGAGGPPGMPALPCETSPLPFDDHAVGVALSGRDTGSSQLFVMHGRAPHLDGRYARVGVATGPWAAFVDGDVIKKVTVEP